MRNIELELGANAKLRERNHFLDRPAKSSESSAGKTRAFSAECNNTGAATYGNEDPEVGQDGWTEGHAKESTFQQAKRLKRLGRPAAA